MERQRFYVSCYCVANGETWEVSVLADNPEHALATVLRRRLWVQRLLSEDAFQFVVSHAPVLLRPYGVRVDPTAAQS